MPRLNKSTRSTQSTISIGPIAMDFGRYGDCAKLGVGYSQTKAAMGITPHEQLTLCGIQDFLDDSCMIWGTETEEWHDHLMPEGPRHTRAKSHLFSTTLTPTIDGSFDVEYVLQLDIGGNIPTFFTAPIVIDNVKTMFKTVKAFFAQGEGGSLDMLLKEQAARDHMGGRHSILMTPYVRLRLVAHTERAEVAGGALRNY